MTSMLTTPSNTRLYLSDIRHAESFIVVLCNIPTENIRTQSASAFPQSTLLQYGRADVIRTFFSPSLGSLKNQICKINVINQRRLTVLLCQGVESLATHLHQFLSFISPYLSCHRYNARPKIKKSMQEVSS